MANLELFFLENSIKTKLTVMSTYRLIITKEGQKIIGDINGFKLAKDNDGSFYLIEENENPDLKNTKKSRYKCLYGRIVEKLDMPHLTKLDMIELEEKYKGMRVFKLNIIPTDSIRHNIKRGKK